MINELFRLLGCLETIGGGRAVVNDAVVSLLSNEIHKKKKTISDIETSGMECDRRVMMMMQ